MGGDLTMLGVKGTGRGKLGVEKEPVRERSTESSR
jgi:hypothetical protein